MNSDTELSNDHEKGAPVSSGVNLLLGILPISVCLSQIPLVNILVPWIAWLCVKKENPASRPAFRSVMNMQISWTIYGSILSLVVFVLMFIAGMGMGGFHSHGGNSGEGLVFSGIVFAFLACLVFLPLGIVWLVMTIMFAGRVKNDVNAKPPLTIRFLK